MHLLIRRTIGLLIHISTLCDDNITFVMVRRFIPSHDIVTNNQIRKRKQQWAKQEQSMRYLNSRWLFVLRRSYHNQPI